MKSAPSDSNAMGSTTAVDRFFMLGGGSSLNVHRRHQLQPGETTVLLSSGNGAAGYHYESGFKENVAGAPGVLTDSSTDQWGGEDWATTGGGGGGEGGRHVSPSSSSWATSWVIGPNDGDFPVPLVPVCIPVSW